ncbi:MAG: leucine-rich repeat domain-containing protein [Myxococcales bacterium]|nr:MAG: leucine-rich repeat domain-containing protein [Myxococcales bacterium]
MMNIMLSFVAQLGRLAPEKQATPRASRDFKGDGRMASSRRSSAPTPEVYGAGRVEAKQCAIRFDKRVVAHRRCAATFDDVVTKMRRGLAIGVLLATACGETTQHPPGSGGEGASSGSFTLPLGGAAGVDQGAEGGAAGDGGGTPGAAEEALGGAPSGNSGAAGEVSGGAAGGDDGPHGGGAEAGGGAGGENAEAPPACPDPLVFADPWLEDSVRRAANVPAGPIPRASVEGVGWLNVEDDRIASLVGLECVPHLQELSLRSSSLASLQTLGLLRELKRLILYRGPFSELSPLAQLPLTRLIIVQSDVTDLTPLAGLATLEHLQVQESPVQDLSPLASLTQLRTLNLSKCELDDISPLASLVKLESLDVASNRVVDLAAVSGMKNLISLSVGDNLVRDLTPLRSLERLDYLYVWGNQVTDISPLAEMVELDTLHAENNAITSLVPLTVRFHGFASLSSNRIADFAPLLQFKDALHTGIWLQDQRDESGVPLIDCEAQAETLSLAKAMGFASLRTDCVPK